MVLRAASERGRECRLEEPGHRQMTSPLDTEKKSRWFGGRTFWAAIGGAVLGGCATFIVQDFLNFQSSNRQVIVQEMQALQSTSEQIAILLQQFSAEALGNGAASDEDMRALRDQFTRLLDQASQLKTLVPAASDAYTRFADAMIELKNAAEAMGGQYDGGKAYVEAFSQFYDSKLDFENAVVAEQRTYRLPL